jgi:pimeloyl-ACP methyl ester carboxylesterase
VADYLVAWAKTDIQAGVQGKTLPVLVLPGEHDPALGEATCRATWMQDYPNAQLEVLRNAGHYPMDETPIWLATVIEKYLAGVPA